MALRQRPGRSHDHGNHPGATDPMSVVISIPSAASSDPPAHRPGTVVTPTGTTAAVLTFGVACFIAASIVAVSTGFVNDRKVETDRFGATTGSMVTVGDRVTGHRPVTTHSTSTTAMSSQRHRRTGGDELGKVHSAYHTLLKEYPYQQVTNQAGQVVNVILVKAPFGASVSALVT